MEIKEMEYIPLEAPEKKTAWEVLQEQMGVIEEALRV